MKSPIKQFREKLVKPEEAQRGKHDANKC